MTTFLSLTIAAIHIAISWEAKKYIKRNEITLKTTEAMWMTAIISYGYPFITVNLLGLFISPKELVEFFIMYSGYASLVRIIIFCIVVYFGKNRFTFK